MSEQYSHITGDYYMNREAFPSYAWYSAAVLCIMLPPVGMFMVAFYGVASLTTDPETEDDSDD